ncbi:MAG: outer membrane protein assembly factor BamA [Acidobacteria bacterium]|nr:outer membrane protein assembly factor BamA [Acidobacteriota bacterium]
MRIRAPWIYLVAALLGSLTLLNPVLPVVAARVRAQEPAAPPSPQQELVERLLIEGNRRLRDEDVLYHIQTREGDVFNEAQVRRDLQALLNLPFFDKTETSVSTERGTRGRIVIFKVKELPVIRDITFEGLSSVTEADVLKSFREQRVGISKESTFDPVKLNNARRVIKELLAEKGHPNATVEVEPEEISLTSVALPFKVDEGDRVRVVEVDFDGNQVFSDGELRSQMKLVKEAGLISRFKGQDILHLEKLEYDLRVNVVNYMRSKGYLEARTGEPKVEGVGPRRTGFPILPLPIISSTDEGLRVTVPVVEGRLYRLGTIKIEGNSIYSEEVIRQVIGLTPGEVANGQRLVKALSEDLDRLYGRSGFVQYEYDVAPAFKDNPQNPKEGIADFTVTITEGKQFSLRRLEFLGNTFTRDNVLRREVAVNEGDIYDKSLWEFSILKLNQLGFFDPIDKDKDAELRTDEERGELDINLRVTERGRNQIAFNGGLSGVGGSFFGLDYSTNNLLGRGESLSFQFAFGNRQKSILFSFTEPYIKDRPITVGFSLFTESRKFFGEGTILSQNVEAIGGAFGNQFDFLNASEENLFTQTTTGASLFASSPLSEFWRPRSRRLIQIARASRIGLSYSISRSSIADPPVNESGDQANFIPRVFDQPNITTSRLTPTLVYDTRNASIDPTAGQQLTLQMALAGIGGDVRTYQPFYLGDEFSIRGYNVRSIGPLVPLEVFVSSQNVQVTNNVAGDITPVAGISETLRGQLRDLGTFTGATGSNSLLIDRQFRLLGGDTQLLGNFEYRVPIFGPITLAAFADIGTAFNLRTSGDQTFSTQFLGDLPFLSSLGGLTALARRRNPQLAASPISGALLVTGDRLLTQEQFENLRRVGPTDPVTGLPFGVQPVFLRGEAQTNTVARLSQSLFSKFGDYRSSVGGELRIQLPVVNVPFRFIYAYNPNARVAVLGEKRSLFRFSIGRTF